MRMFLRTEDNVEKCSVCKALVAEMDSETHAKWHSLTKAVTHQLSEITLQNEKTPEGWGI